jgi:hypothetical protein
MEPKVKKGFGKYIGPLTMVWKGLKVVLNNFSWQKEHLSLPPLKNWTSQNILVQRLYDSKIKI